MDIYLSSAYLAPLSYYAKFFLADKIYIEQCDNYIKQTYRNRCTIVGANGQIPLSIPVEHISGGKALTRDIRIADHGNWQHMHWNTIVSAYNSTPFFEYYQDDFYPFYHRKFNFLFDFNEQLRDLIFHLIDIDQNKVTYTDNYKVDFTFSEIDMRESIHPKKDWHAEDHYFISHPYYQVFAQKFGFIDNMSIIDLLFNMGNESLIILHNSQKSASV